MGTRLTAAAQAIADKRAAMIAEAAYFVAERRNFRPGNELSDWLAAEREIESGFGSAKQARTGSATQGKAKTPGKKKAEKVAVKKTTVKKAAAKKASTKKAGAKKTVAKNAVAKPH